MSNDPNSAHVGVPAPQVQIQSLTPQGMTQGLHQGIPAYIPQPAPAPTVYAPAYGSQPAPVPTVYAPQVEYAVAEVPEMYYEPVAIEEPRKKNPFMVYWNKIGGGSFMISLLIHAGILIAAYFIVETIVQEQKVDFLPGGGSKQGQEATQQLSQQVQNKKRSTLNKQTPMRKVVSNSATATISLPDTPMDTIDMPEMSSIMGGAAGSGGFGGGGAGGGFGKGIGIGGQSGFVSLPPSMKSRCSAAERLQRLKESGGTSECEKAVSNALEYFKTKQNADGSWGDTYKASMTGFALLCFLGRCETPESPFYGDNVMKGIMYLVELSKKDPEGIISEASSSNGAATYEHGIATYALGEMYTLARLGSKSLPGMREAFENGVRAIIKNQLPTGAWAYGDFEKRLEGSNPYRTTGGGGDPSVTGWQFQALKAAKLTGLKIPDLHTSIAKTVKYYEGIQDKEGGFGSTNREGAVSGYAYTQWTMTGIGTLCMQTLATGKSVSAKKGVKWSHEFFQKEPPKFETADFYSWYYFQQAFFQNGGEEWNTWNKQVLPILLSHQQPNGSWKGGAKTSGGSPGGKDIYSTAQCTLMLEVYYRYLKVADKEEGSIFDRK